MTIIKKIAGLFTRAMDPEDNLSSKRLVLFLAAGFFWVFCSAMLVTGIISMFTVTKGNIDVLKLVFNLFEGIREDNKILILGCLGLVGAQNLGQYIVAKAKVTPPDVTVAEGATSTIVQNAETITPAETVTAQNVENVNTQSNVTTKETNGGNLLD